MHEAAASCKDNSRALVTNWEPHGVKLAGYCYAMRHGMKVQIPLVSVTRNVTALRYAVTFSSVYPP
jgi:hypothetical protein